MMHLTRNEYHILLRRDPLGFAHRVFRHLHPTQPFLSNWHIEVILAKLEACRLGQCRRLIINVPPRSLKSILTSGAFPAWTLGHDPSKQFMCVSYAEHLAHKHARDCRSIVQADWYRALFPAMQLSEQRQAVAEFATTMNGHRIATSVGGVVTGLGADFIVIDDPLKPDEAMSEPRRKSANDWIASTLYSRLNNKKTGVIIIVMQRLHEDDLVGFVQRQSGEQWEVLSFSAIAEEPQTFAWETFFGKFEHRRAAGDALHPEREPLEQLSALRVNLGEYHFACQYQQNPAPLGGGMVKEEWFKRYRASDLPDKFDRVIQSWDTANKPSELSDFSVCTTWGLKDKRIYLLNVLRKQLDYPNLKRAVQEQHDLHQPDVLLIEDKVSGTQLIQELRDAGVSAVTAYKSSYDKIMRLDAQTGVIENGLVYLPEEAHWLAEYLHELKTFPKARYDDQVDSTSQALEWLKQRYPGQGIFEYQKSLYEEKRAAEQEEVELVALGGDSHVQLVRRGNTLIGTDRKVMVPREDVHGLLQSGRFKLA
jgi:predicted phage terminase large subunit-like protein